MAYVAFSPAAHLADPVPAWSPAVTAAAAIDTVPAEAPVAVTPRFSALEWSVVALAEREPLSSLRAPGRVAVALGALFGTRAWSPLADRRLEALRRLSVLTWHHGYQAPASAINDFVEAGFSLDQYELLAASIAGARDARRRPRAA